MVYVVVDLSIPTNRQLTKRRPDIVLHLKGEQKIMILEGAVAWEPLLGEREKQKSDKYQELAADLATRHPGRRVTVVPIVAGTLRQMRANLHNFGIFTQWESTHLVREIQFQVLCLGVRLIRRQLAVWCACLLTISNRRFARLS